MARMNSRPTAARVLRGAGIVLLALVSLYVVIQFFVIFDQSYKTETAIAYTMADSVTLEGVAAFDAVTVVGE